MKAAPEYSDWLALLEPPPNLSAELSAALASRRSGLWAPLLPFGTALLASGPGDPPLRALETAAATARTPGGPLRFGPPAWRGDELRAPPDAPTARVLERIAAALGSEGSVECAGPAAETGLGLTLGFAGADGRRASFDDRAPLSFRSFRLSLWRAAWSDPPASGCLLTLAGSAWVRIRDSRP